MKLSKKTYFSFRLLFELGINREHGPILLKRVAKKYKISEKYLWQVIPPLKNVGLISSIRGAKGGYSLNKEPKDITLNDIVTAIEGPLIFEETKERVRPPAAKNDLSIIEGVWQEATRKVNAALKSITLDALLARHEKNAGVLFYEI